ncbi:MAG: T9SS type A sorting domain-containing protein [Bacteroidetes bacterium]|nr:T9SS type A sorting domain-containing protein [Bacteroidota bacterium]
MNPSSNVDVFIGNNPGATLKPFDGIIDEVRVGNTARSLDWISTEYNNQNSPQTFYSRSGLDGTIFIPEPLNCDEKITVVGKGAQGQPSVTLAIPNISNIDKIRVESVFLGTKPSYITYSSTTQTIVDNTPEYAINGGTNKGSYHAIMQPTSSITITPSNNTSSVHSAVAYIYRSDTTFNSITYIEIFKVYQYRTTSPSYTKVFSIEPGLESRDIVITIPVAELTNDNRKIEITATAGAISKTIVEYRDNLGASLRIIEITLENVPGDITSVIVNIDSPDSDGDSFVAGNILIEVPCDDVQAPIEGGVLPIELLYLNATCGSQSEVIVKWSTASEINNDFFTIYKSLDGSSWTSVTEIKGSGNSNQVNNYEFTDEIPDAHDTYYKLKQTDFNGDSKEFEIIFVYCKFNHKKITFYPNPAKDNINLSFINEHQIEKALEVSVYNSGGQIVHTQEFLSTKNENLHNVILPDHLKPGIYFVHVMLGNEYFYTGQISIIK